MTRPKGLKSDERKELAFTMDSLLRTVLTGYNTLTFARLTLSQMRLLVDGAIPLIGVLFLQGISYPGSARIFHPWESTALADLWEFDWVSLW